MEGRGETSDSFALQKIRLNLGTSNSSVTYKTPATTSVARSEVGRPHV